MGLDNVRPSGNEPDCLGPANSAVCREKSVQACAFSKLFCRAVLSPTLCFVIRGTTISAITDTTPRLNISYMCLTVQPALYDPFVQQRASRSNVTHLQQPATNGHRMPPTYHSSSYFPPLRWMLAPDAAGLSLLFGMGPCCQWMRLQSNCFPCPSLYYLREYGTAIQYFIPVLLYLSTISKHI